MVPQLLGNILFYLLDASQIGAPSLQGISSRSVSPRGSFVTPKVIICRFTCVIFQKNAPIG
jgi:hypothetical protein